MMTASRERGASCSSCRAPVFYAVNEKTGNAAPIDAGQDPDGIIVLKPGTDPLEYRVLTKVERTDPAFADVPRFTSHFATCRHADRHRPQRR